MIFDILEAKLRTLGLVDGQTLFRNFMPAEVTAGVMLRAPLQGVRIDPYIPGFHKTALQAIIRHTDPVEGLKLAQRVSNVLTVRTPELHAPTTEHGRVKISVFYPRELPIQFPRLDGNAIEWSVNFVTAFTLEALAV